MVKQTRILFLLLIAQSLLGGLANQAPSAKPVFVFDLNGVLFTTKTATVFRQIGIRDILSYLARHRSTKMIKSRFYQTLNRITNTQGNSAGLTDPDGMVMPEIMVDWLRGSRSNQAILDRILTAIKMNPEWFTHTNEQRIMAAVSSSIFDPKKFVASRKLLPNLIPFITALKKNGAQLYILSNWDKESFMLLKEQYKDLFDLFDDCIISGEIGYVKPEPQIFNHITNKIPANCTCFLDDQEENIDAGEKAGFYTILVKPESSRFNTTINTKAITQKGIDFFKRIQSIHHDPLKHENKDLHAFEK